MAEILPIRRKPYQSINQSIFRENTGKNQAILSKKVDEKKENMNRRHRLKMCMTKVHLSCTTNFSISGFSFVGGGGVFLCFIHLPHFS